MHGEVNFHLTQFLSEYGFFKQYLYRFGHALSPFCPLCSERKETAEHVVFDCPRFNMKRSATAAAFGQDYNAHRMVSDPNPWNLVNNIVVEITSTL